MNLETAIELFRQAVTNALMLVAPILITTIVVGLVISLFQSVTSIQEQTLSFAPKLFAVGGVLIVGSAWLMRTLMSFTIEVYQKIPEIGF
ncbi:flagellar biosynthesis protein FliQ [Pelagicoccus sp. SDUM812003]|uniref:flagellar biosynthesis protein FliQ n=1 Tax=Pelagicoccus sp. SDUM812003 TaxID=3041267 RepID=UPI00280E6AE6|nr:flagellar biosynthesis protein FliQ [Pelagicoccus sp. SDUM812003]MDQ8202544.1 flagellar biosynthesis protein FliQ [Pelagicoccus sp. SDUM812003]